MNNMIQLLIDICYAIIAIIITILLSLLYLKFTGENVEFAMWIVETMITIIVILRQFKRSDNDNKK